jgi:hypothetical protein
LQVYRGFALPSEEDDKAEIRWRVVRINSTPAKLIGHVYAPDDKTAIKRAIAQFDIQKPRRNRLMAVRET